MKDREHLVRALIPSLGNGRRFLLSLTLVGLLGSTLIAVVLPQSYESVANLTTVGQPSPGALYVGVLESRTVQEHLIDQFNLRKEYWDRTEEGARKDLEKHSRITYDDERGLIAIAVKDTSPVRAAAMVQDYVDEMNRLLTQLDTLSAHRERISLENSLGDIQPGLESAQAALSQFSSKNQFVDMETQKNGMLIVPGEIQGAVIAEPPPEDEKEDTISPEFDPQAPPPQNADGAQDDIVLKTVSALQKALFAEQANLKGLQGVYGDASVEVRTTQAKIDHLELELRKLMGYSAPASPSGQDRQSVHASVRELPLLARQYIDLRRDVGIDELLVGGLNHEDEIAKISEVRDTPSLKLLDPPEVPENASWGSRVWIILLTTTFSFALGVAWVCAAVTLRFRL